MDLASLLVELVNIPSVTGSEAALADWVEARLRRLAARAPATTTPRPSIQRLGHNVVWRGPSVPGRPLVVLAGHLDTVPPAGNERARREGDLIYGLGAADMKGGDAVLLALLETLEPAALGCDLAAVFYEGEEGGLERNGLRRLLASPEFAWLRRADLAVLLEPTGLRVELGCNGFMNAEVRVRGRAAHSARPWLGRNAVELAAPWLAEITRFPVTPRIIGGAEFRETLQVTRVAAGRALNVVPEELAVNLNYRFPPDRTPEEAERRLRALVPAEFEFRVADCSPPGRVAADHPLARSFLALSGAAVAGKQGWTDVAQFTAAGVAAFNYGPADPDLCHRADEHCPADHLQRAHDCLARFLRHPSPERA